MAIFNIHLSRIQYQYFHIDMAGYFKYRFHIPSIYIETHIFCQYIFYLVLSILNKYRWILIDTILFHDTRVDIIIIIINIYYYLFIIYSLFFINYVLLILTFAMYASTVAV